MASSTEILIFAAKKEYIDNAEVLAKRLNTSVVSVPPLDRLYLSLDNNGLSLVRGRHSLRGDLTRLLPRLQPHNLNGELLVKAARIKNAEPPLLAVDATAGMGEDSLLLAAAGFHVRLFENDPIIALLLEDSLRRGADEPRLRDIIGRMELTEADSITALRQLEVPPHVVFLDPMFPERQKSSLIKKKFQLLQQLEKPCADEDKLLEAAIESKPLKIVVKRPLKGPFLGNKKPDHSLKGKAIRYDCILFPKQR